MHVRATLNLIIRVCRCIELQVGIICGCLPPLRTPFPNLFPASWFGSRLNRKLPSNKKGFASLSESTRPTSRRHSKNQEWFDMEQSSKGFESSVETPPQDGALRPELEKASQDRGMPRPLRTQQPVIHKQKDYAEAGDGELAIARAL